MVALLPLAAACHQAAAPLSATAISRNYDTCRQQAGGDASALIACADRAQLAAWSALPGTLLTTFSDQAVARAGGDSLMVRVTVSDALARLAIDKALIDAHQPLSTAPEAVPDSGMQSELAPLAKQLCAVPDAKSCAARDQLLYRLTARLVPLTPVKVRLPEMPTPILGGYVPPTCADVRAAPTDDGAFNEFEASFPAALQDEHRIDKVALSDDQLQAISAYLACLVRRVPDRPDVAESSLWLYSSKRHGARAMAALERLGQGSGADAEAAREFASQLDDYQAAQ